MKTIQYKQTKDVCIRNYVYYKCTEHELKEVRH